MSTPETPKPPREGWGGMLGSVLNYVDRPWRAVFILLVILIGGIGFAAYQEREALLKVLLHKPPAKAVMRTASTNDTITGLFESTHIDAVSIWSINLSDNTVEYLTGRRREGTPWLITPRVLRLFTENSNAVITAKLLRGEPVCDDPTQSKALLGQALVDDGMKWVCFVPEPPVSTQLLVGYVLLGFKTIPNVAVAEAAISAVLKQTDNIIAQ